MTRSRFSGPAALALLTLAAAHPASAQTPFTVSGTANIFGAGYGDTPAPGGFGGGTVAPSFSFTSSPGQYVTLANVTGTVTPNIGSGSTLVGPDGFSQSVNIGSYRSLSGVSDPTTDFYLVGVFTSGTPSGAAPAGFDFSNKSAASYNPLLNQVFFIGDGLTGTGSGTQQKFFVPTGATALTLGYADAPNFNGSVGAYGDNSGQLTGGLTFGPPAVPEASTTVSLGLLLALGAILRMGGVVIAGKRRKNKASS